MTLTVEQMLKCHPMNPLRVRGYPSFRETMVLNGVTRIICVTLQKLRIRKRN